MKETNGGQRESRALDLLRELVLTPSAPRDDKNAIVGKVVGPLKSWGFECEVLENGRSPAVIAHKGKRGILLSGHLDTVPLGEGWGAEQGETRGTLLYGRGAADMKGGCAAMLLAAERSADSDTPLSLAFTTDEETGMNGAEKLSKHEAVANAKAIVVCEPTSLTMGLREKGLLQLRLASAGKSAHAAMPCEGENAVHKMLSGLERIMPMTALPTDPMADMTVSVSVMRGGEKVNVIPDSCIAEVDIRTSPEVQPDEALNAIKERLIGAGLDFTVIHQLDPIILPTDSALAKELNKIRPGMGHADIAYATELVKYRSLKIDMLALGPGEAKYAHRIDERIDLREVVEAADIYSMLSSAF